MQPPRIPRLANEEPLEHAKWSWTASFWFMFIVGLICWYGVYHLIRWFV
jgi:hypothetical protein